MGYFHLTDAFLMGVSVTQQAIQNITEACYGTFTENPIRNCVTADTFSNENTIMAKNSPFH